MSVFSNPAVHGVEQITARAETFSSRSRLVACLTLKFSGESSLGGQEGEMDIYAEGLLADKFQRIAEFINAEFADETTTAVAAE